MDYKAEMIAVVRRVKQALRRSSERHKLTPEEAVENPEKAKDVLCCFIRKSPTLRRHLRFEHESLDVQQSTRFQKCQRVMVLTDDQGDAFGGPSDSKGSSSASPAGPAFENKLRMPSKNPLADRGESIITVPNTKSLTSGTSASSPNAVQKEIFSPVTTPTNDNGLKVQDPSGEPSTPNELGSVVGAAGSSGQRFSNAEVIFGVSAWLQRSGHDYKFWHELMGRAVKMMRENPSVISGQYVDANLDVPFECVIEKSRPAKPWELDIDDLGVSAWWILTAVGLARHRQNEVRELLNIGLDHAWKKIVKTG